MDHARPESGGQRIALISALALILTGGGLMRAGSRSRRQASPQPIAPWVREPDRFRFRTLTSMPSPASSDVHSAVLREAADRALRYLAGLEGRRVAPSPEALAGLEQLRTALPPEGLAGAEVLATLDRLGSPATMASAGGRFFGFVVGGALPTAVAASWLATAWDQNAGITVLSPVAAAVEDVALQWLTAIFAGAGGRSGRVGPPCASA